MRELEDLVCWQKIKAEQVEKIKAKIAQYGVLFVLASKLLTQLSCELC